MTYNHNKLRSSVPALTLVILLGGAAGCGLIDKSETPRPDKSSSAPQESTVNVSPYPDPACQVRLEKLDGREATIGVTTQDTSELGAYTVDATTYDFGDGDNTKAPGINHVVHTYQLGTFTVGAYLTLDSISNSHVDSPVKDGEQVACDPLTLTVVG